MQNTNTTQPSGNSAASDLPRENALKVLNCLVSGIAQGTAPDCGKRVMVSVLFEEAVAIYEDASGQRSELAAVLLGVAAALLVDMVRTGEVSSLDDAATSVTRH